MTRLDTYLAVDSNEEKIQLSYDESAYRYAYNSSNNVQYVGKSLPGSLSASSVWQIKRFDYDGVTTSLITACLWASGSRDYESIWDNRASGITYL